LGERIVSTCKRESEIERERAKIELVGAERSQVFSLVAHQLAHHLEWTAGTLALQGYLTHTNLPPPYDHRRALGIGLLQGPRRGVFLMSEVPL